MAEQVFRPETIQEQALPIPGVEILTQSPSSGQPSNRDSYSPGVTLEQQFPLKIPAPEVISSTLDTKLKKIKGEYTFTTMGAITVGVYELGISGDIKISPNGIVARNVNGETTFALDGVSGDAVFKGTLQAGTLIGGDSKALIDKDENNNGRIVLFSAGGLPSVIICA